MAKRILVVCYSRSGLTRRVAAHLAETLGADLEEIEDIGSRSGFVGYIRSALEAAARGLPTIRTRKDPRDYDLFVLGSPVWTGTMASPVRSYIHAHAARFHDAAFFAVMAGRGAEDTVREMQAACGISSAPTCVLTQREVEQGLYRKLCEPFVEALRQGVKEQAARQSTAA